VSKTCERHRQYRDSSYCPLLFFMVVNVETSLNTQLSLEEPSCSQVALFWIKGIEKEFKNHVDKICKLISVDCWSHCVGKINPANIPSRSLTPLELSVNKLWRTGPKWLSALLVSHNYQMDYLMSCLILGSRS